jgi:hypothetical protein
MLLRAMDAVGLFAVAVAVAVLGLGLSGCVTPAAVPQTNVYVNAQTANVYLDKGPSRRERERKREPERQAVEVQPSDDWADWETPVAPTSDADTDSTSSSDGGTSDCIYGWVTIGLGGVFGAQTVLWHEIAAGDESSAKPSDSIVSDAFLGASALSGLLGGYFLYRGYFADDAPSVQVSAAPAPGGGAFAVSGTF